MSASGHPPRLLDQVRGALRRKHSSLRTEEASIGWLRRFIRVHTLRHPREMGSRDIGAFLTYLAVEAEVAVSTQNQALSALLFLYREVLQIELDADLSITPAKRPQYLPAVLSRAEVRDVLAALSGTHQVMAHLRSGSGLRLLEWLRLRVNDRDSEQRHLIVRQGNGGKDRATVLPTRWHEPLRAHLEHVRSIHEQDRREGFGEVWLLDALAQTLPSASHAWVWQYVFPASRRSVDPRSGRMMRHHQDESGLQKAVRRAAQQAAVSRSASPATRFAIALRRMCLRLAMICAPCRSFWATRMGRPR
ncbi:MAG: integron integrase [Chloroflexus sp.]|uniref:integron integrase n=1 Tax=Chloroflexus sp. TaxID=1904827 RepID=UPI0021DB9F1F|nr:MAG: integron integrase [Chloroflexus sp.]